MKTKTDDDGERLHCGSTSGDVASFGTAGCVLRALAPCCKGGALVLAKDWHTIPQKAAKYC